jgi:hypothetical protein
MKIIATISSATLRIIYGNRGNLYLSALVLLGLVGRSLRSLSKHWGFCLSEERRGFPPFRLFHTRPFWVNFDGITGSLSRLSKQLLPSFLERHWYDWRLMGLFWSILDLLPA